MPHRTHRHYVFLPLLLLLTVSSTVAGSRIAPADLTTAKSPCTVLPSGGCIAVSQGGKWFSDEHGGELKSGSVLVHSSAPVTVHAGDLRITVMGGAVFISKDVSSVTLAAISTSALVQDGDAFFALPSGMQWKTGGERLPTLKEGISAWIAARSASPLPERFLEEQRRRAAEMPSGIHLPESLAGPVPPPGSRVLDAAQLPHTAARASEDWQETVLGIIRNAIEHDDTESLQQLLARADLADLWGTQRARDVIAILLLNTPRSVTFQQLLLPILARNPDLLLLSSLHPFISTVSWTLPSGHLGMERLAARMIAFPFADTGTDAHRGLAWLRWGEDMGTFLQTEKYTPQALGSVTGLLGPLAILREQQGYPERSRLLAQVLLENAKRIQGEMDSETTHTLDSLRSLDSVNIRALPTQDSSVQSSVASSAASTALEFDHADTERRARGVLRQAGAIISLETRIIPESGDSARVENIVFGGVDRDRTVSFDLNLDRGSADHIIDGTEEYPYAMPWEDFVRWMVR